MLRSLLTLILATVPLAARAEWQALFNGKDLDGWSGDPAVWSVHDGILTGRTQPEKASATPSSTFLIWNGGEPDDFELEFQAKVTGNNSGLQYRSHLADAAVRGYQLDLHSQPEYLGMLYEQGGRGLACLRGQQVILRDKAEVTGKLETRAVDLAQWNAYRIVAHGNLLQHFINDQLVAETRDMDPNRSASKGIIAVQLEAGAATTAEFKNIRIQHITRSKTAPKVNAEARRTPSWIWSSKAPGPKDLVHFRREIQLPPALARAQITISCDDQHRLFVNNEEIGSAGDWSHPHSYTITDHLKEGRNVIAIEGRNTGGSAALAVSMTTTLVSGRSLQIVSDESWFCSQDPAPEWRTLDFKPEGWQKAVIVAEMGDEPWGDVMPDSGPVAVEVPPAASSLPQ